MSAAVSQAQALAKGGNPKAVELADIFCRHARRRAEELFATTFNSDDVATYRLAQQVLAGDHAWIEEGMVREK